MLVVAAISSSASFAPDAQRAQLRGDRGLAVEPGSRRGVGQGDEPFRARQVGNDTDTGERLTARVVGFRRHEDRAARPHEPLQLGDPTRIERAGDQLCVVPAVR